MESEVDCNNKVQLEVEGSTAAGSDHGPNVESSEKSLDDCAMKEVGLSSSNAESSVLSFNAAEESDKNFVRQQLNLSDLDLVDSNSQTDSLESNWGSVSVLSIQSDIQAVIDAKAVPPTDSQASLEEKSKAATEDKSDMFETLSFMTLNLEALITKRLLLLKFRQDRTRNSQNQHLCRLGGFLLLLIF